MLAKKKEQKFQNCSFRNILPSINHELVVWRKKKLRIIQNGKKFRISGAVRGGSGGSADPPKMLKPIEEKLEIEQPDPPKSRARQSDPRMKNSYRRLCTIKFHN